MSGIPPLRPYQTMIVRAVLDSVKRGLGLSFTVLIARQGGKNELSAQLELAVLMLLQRRPVESVKTAPTLTPQLMISSRRLWGLVEASGLSKAKGLAAREEGGVSVRIGAARQRFLSAEPTASVVGHTVGGILECDETQDVDAEVWDKRFRPMGATTNATTVYYGTAWDETCLLAGMIAHHQELERADGIRRHFAVPWEEVAGYNPAYRAYVEAERARLGEQHPVFQTQYLLQTLAGSGRLLGPAARSLMLGIHPRLLGRPMGEPRGVVYVASLDVGGEDFGAGRDHDASVLTVGRVVPARAGAIVRDPAVEVVQQYVWVGLGQVALAQSIAGILRGWAVARLVVDATGVGEGLASSLMLALSGVEVLSLKLTQQSKSRVGFGLAAAAGGGRLRLYGNDGSPEWRQTVEQCAKAFRQLLPNGLMAWGVKESDGHDDHIMGLGLLVEASLGLVPTMASGRRGEVQF